MNKSFLKYQLKYWLPVYLYLILIFYLSSQSILPASAIAAERFYIKPYLQHILIYTGLALTISRASNYSKNSSSFLVVFSTTLYGLTDEIHQYFVPGRTFEFLDIGMDFLGAILALIVLNLYNRIKHN
ncbi:VanZ family protein [Candidatus Woesearchaeota archaeon]|nr:VanZ family protein [Candidatus Woesearchaeota archaeon]